VTDDPVIGRLRRRGAGEAIDALERMPESDRRSLLLHLTRRRSAGRTPAALLHDRMRDRTVQPAGVDVHALHDAEGHAIAAAASGFELLALSPVAPGGVNTVLAGIDQNRSLATVRGTEVLADPTTGLAIEAAVRRRGGEVAPSLGALSRVLRMQRFQPPWHQHFALFSLVSAGRSEPAHRFAVRALGAHLTVYLDAIACIRASGRAIGAVTVEVTDTVWLGRACRAGGHDLRRLAERARAADAEGEGVLAAAGIPVPRFTEDPGDAPLSAAIAEGVLGPLRERHPDVSLGFRPGRLAAAGYYAGVMLSIDVELDGQRLSVADGGTVDWTQRLLSDRRERLLVSGIGLERLVR
jgi:hypothetical protein